MSLGRQIRTSPGLQIKTPMAWSDRTFRGCSGDVGGGRLGTSWGPIFAGWGKLFEKDATVVCYKCSYKFLSFL